MFINFISKIIYCNLEKAILHLIYVTKAKNHRNDFFRTSKKLFIHHSLYKLVSYIIACLAIFFALMDVQMLAEING